MDFIKPVQIIGTQRSGSNLLRLMLNQIEGVFAPHPPHILSVFYPLANWYGDLEHDNNFRALINDVCTLVELNPVPWEVKLDPGKIFEVCQQRSLIEIFKNIYELGARKNNSKLWVCKSMQNVRYINDFSKNNLRPQIIYLYRDGRDVALSFQKAIVGPKHIYCIADKWEEEQMLSLNVIENTHQYNSLSVSYESLILDPEVQMKRICGFLEVEYNTKILKFYTSKESKRTAQAGEMWRNLTHPIIKRNINKYKSEMPGADIYLFESVANKSLIRLGYKLNHSLVNNGHSFSESEVLAFKRQNEILANKSLRKAKKEDLEKRIAQNNFIDNLKSKLKSSAA